MEYYGRLHVGLDVLAASAPLSGIPSYVSQLTIALGAIAGSHGVRFTGFDLLRWVRMPDQVLSPLPEERTEASISNDWVHFLRQHALKHELIGKTLRPAFSTIRALAYDLSVARQDIDFFHALSFRPPGLRSTVPCVPVVYDLSFVRYPELHPQPRLRWLKHLPQVLENAPLVHTISRFSAEEIEDVYNFPGRNIRVIPPGVSPIYFCHDVPHTGILDKLQIRRGQYVISVGTLEPRKNLETLLRAYALLPKPTRLKMPLVLIGRSGWGNVRDSSTLRSLVADGTAIVAGFLSDLELHNLYSNARALFFPSIYEGFGMPISEALACGCPVVASNVASMPEAAAGAARLVPPLDIEAWNAELRHSIDSDEFGDVSARKRRKEHVSRFTWKHSAEQTLRLYNEVASLL